jgi:hypothetical protein
MSATHHRIAVAILREQNDTDVFDELARRAGEMRR